MHLHQYRPSRNPSSWAITKILLMALLLLVSTPAAAPAQVSVIFKDFVTRVMVELTAKKAGTWFDNWLNRKPPGYRFVLSWEVEEGSYFGTLVMRDTTGKFTVRTPGRVLLNQDMTARRRPDGLWLVGSNLTWAPNSPRPDSFYYNVDRFHVVEAGDDQWMIDDICDAERCAKVEILEASTF